MWLRNSAQKFVLSNRGMRDNYMAFFDHDMILYMKQNTPKMPILRLFGPF